MPFASIFVPIRRISLRSIHHESTLSLSLSHDFVGGVFVVVVLLLVRAVVQTQDLPAQMHRVAKEHQEEKEGPLHQESRLQDQQQRRFRSKPVIYDRITNPVL